jgi:hypothetical protein
MKPLPFNQGMSWIVAGFQSISRQFAGWMALSGVYLAIHLLLSFIPLGPLAISLLAPVFWVGIYRAGRNSTRRQQVSPALLFEPLREHGKPLLTLGGILMVLNLLLAQGYTASLASIVDLNAMREAWLAGNQQALIQMFAKPEVFYGFVLRSLVAMAVAVPIAMAGWFAPVLVAEHGKAPLAAMGESLAACAINWLPFLLYSIGLALLFFMAILTLGLALILVLPWYLATYQASTDDIWPPDTPAENDTNDEDTTVSLSI